MARKSTTSLELENAQLRDELIKLREQVEAQTSAAAATKNRLSAVVGNVTPHAELMVGIRNISDYTVGIPPVLPGDPSLQLAPDFGDNEPGSVAVISYAAWRELRKGKLVEQGMIRRDDSVLGSAFLAAPEDREGELAPGSYVNTIEDPPHWINSRSEDELREDIARITSQASLFRLRRVVDTELLRLEADSGMSRETREDQARCAQAALSKLSTKYRLVDDLTTAKIEVGRQAQAGIDPSGRRISLRL